MPIEFPCSTCGQLVRTPETAAGKKGKCPHCAAIVEIPLRSQRTEDRRQGTAGVTISFPCESCGETVRTPMSAAGKKGKCPHCQAVVQIPGGASPAPASPTPAPAALPPSKPRQTAPWKGQPSAAPKAPLPKPAAPPAEEVEELPTLTPIDSVPGLVPLTPTGGLTPLAPNPFGGPAPLGDDLLAGLPPVNTSGRTLGPTNIVPSPYGGSPGFGPLGGAAAGFTPPGMNPYASPAAAYGPVPGYGSGEISDAGRKGLPWEREASGDSFQDTAMMVLGEPTRAFRQMRRSGGLINPMIFFVMALLIGQLAYVIYLTIISAIIVMAGNPNENALAGLAIGAGIQLVATLISVLIFGPIVTFIAAGFWHVILLVTGCGRGGFEGTYRAFCFSAGSTALLNIIPIVGPLIGLFYGIALLIHGFAGAHEVSGGRMAAVVLSIYALLCCCAIPGVATLMGAAMQGGGGGGF